VWHEGVDKLGRRAAGTRESGAFLLGHAKGKTCRIEQFLFYDDVDPNCFAHGIVEFDGGKFGIVWEECRIRKMKVVADARNRTPGIDYSGLCVGETGAGRNRYL